MTNPSVRDPDCDFWFDQYDFECTCRASASRPVADPAQDLRAIQEEIAELKRRIGRFEARAAASPMPG